MERGRGRGGLRLQGEQFKHPDGNGKSDPAEPSLRSAGVAGRSAGEKTHCLLEREASVGFLGSDTNVWVSFILCLPHNSLLHCDHPGFKLDLGKVEV